MGQGGEEEEEEEEEEGGNDAARPHLAGIGARNGGGGGGGSPPLSVFGDWNGEECVALRSKPGHRELTVCSVCSSIKCTGRQMKDATSFFFLARYHTTKKNNLVCYISRKVYTVCGMLKELWEWLLLLIDSGGGGGGWENSE